MIHSILYTPHFLGLPISTSNHKIREPADAPCSLVGVKKNSAMGRKINPWLILDVIDLFYVQESRLFRGDFRYESHALNMERLYFVYLCKLVTFVWLEVVVGKPLEVEVEEVVVGISM